MTYHYRETSPLSETRLTTRKVYLRLGSVFVVFQVELLLCQWGQAPSPFSSIVKTPYSQRRPRGHMASLEYFLNTVAPSLTWSSSWSHTIWSPLPSSHHSIDVHSPKVSYPFQLRCIKFIL
ncbi:hypothetical protein E2C01_052256 [Portunus trituberculatus]|uniref:Uncharacterized protein n=1 Tax=Portunus trituberculatus TaxID=210409 RepID=A0A5B7GDY3_PORTR|nr:hypothetical protein [Portunus trituberculatus]